MSNPALSSRNATQEAAADTRPRTSLPVSANASPLGDGGPLKRSASSPALLSAEKFENTPEKLPGHLAGLSAPALKFQASLVMASMDKLAVPAEAAKLGELLQQKLSGGDSTAEAGAIKHTNFQISALLGELRSRPQQESMETLVKLSDASDKYSDAVAHYPPYKLDFGMKMNTANLNNEVQASYTINMFDTKAKASGRSIESLAEETLSKGGQPPSPELLAAFTHWIKDEISKLPR